MELTTPDFRALAIQCIADDATSYPPAGWAAEFDAAHGSLPAWALKDEKPHEVYLRAARRGKRPPTVSAAVPTYAAQLWNEVAAWLRLHPDAPELAKRVEEIRQVWDDRHEYPEDWAPYQRMIDADAAASEPVQY